MIPGGRGGDDLQTVFVKLFGIEADVVGDDDDLRVGGLAGVEAQAAGSAGDDDADVGVDELVVGESIPDRGGHFLAFHRDLEMDSQGRFVEAVDVLLEAEDPPGISANALEDAVAVEQAVIEDADLGVRFVEELAADIDLGVHSERLSAR